jgi:mannose-6-phosphate isomerase class I
MKRLGILPLKCGVQHYAWGDLRFIPALLGIDNDDGKPFAELWMGAHPDLPSKVLLDRREVPLNELIESNPERILGSAVAREFGGRLPFLLKVLSAAKPLSIQVHPSKERAREGFARENEAGTPLDASERNYRDENHKPELVAALTDFYGLRGFRPLDEIRGTLQKIPELGRLAKDFEPSSAALKVFYAKLMTLGQDDVNSILVPLVKRLHEAHSQTAFTPENREYWVLRADREFSPGGNRDRGLFSFFLLNLVHLRPGESMFLPAGVLHSYLEGSGMEIMASSNNVLRGGLTPKHVDVPELLRNVSFVGGPVEILRADPSTERPEYAYRTSAEEFELSRIELEAGRSYSSGPDHHVEIVVLVDSAQSSHVELEFGAQSLALGNGRACLIPHRLPYTISSAGRATLYKASV